MWEPTLMHGVGKWGSESGGLVWGESRERRVDRGETGNVTDRIIRNESMGKGFWEWGDTKRETSVVHLQHTSAALFRRGHSQSNSSRHPRPPAHSARRASTAKRGPHNKTSVLHTDQLHSFPFSHSPSPHPLGLMILPALSQAVH